jgi:hypothetical protein
MGISEVDPPTDSQQSQRLLAGKQRLASYKADVELVGYQQPFPLTDGDFLRLKHTPNSVLMSLAGALWGSGLTQGLPLVVGFFRNESVSGDRVLMAVGFLMAGFIARGLGVLLNRTRKQVMRRIERHFEDNPGDLGYRLKEP